MSGASVITDKAVDAVLDALEKKGFEQTDLAKPRPEEAVITLHYRDYLCGVEGAEGDGSLRKGGGESGAPSSLSRRTAHLNAGGRST